MKQKTDKHSDTETKLTTCNGSDASTCSIFNRLHQVIWDNYPYYDSITITPQTNMIDDFHGDSLDEVELFIAIEDEFKCELPSGDSLEDLKIVESMISFLSNV